MCNFSNIVVEYEGSFANMKVPNNDLARLMFYLSHVSLILQGSDISDRYTDYMNYDTLSDLEKMEVLDLVKKFSIDNLMDHEIIVYSSDLISKSTIKFVRPSRVPRGSNYRTNFIFVEHLVKMDYKMIITDEYFDDYFFTPSKRLANYLAKPKITQESPLIEDQDKFKAIDDDERKCPYGMGCCNVF